MPTKKTTNKKTNKSTQKNDNLRTILIGLSVFFNAIFVVLIVGFYSGLFNWYLANYSIDKLTDKQGCFLAQGSGVKQDANKRVLSNDGKVLCVQAIYPNEVK